MTGEMEAVRRIEAEGGYVPRKAFGFASGAGATSREEASHRFAAPNVVEIERLTWPQRIAGLIGEVLACGYIAIMAWWIDQERGGTGWSNDMNNEDIGMFNVHVICGFIGLFFVSQAYILYRALPITMNPTYNRIIYVSCHLFALTCFALAIAASVMSQPLSENQSMSMHAWTAYLAVFVYAAHAIYSSIRIFVDPERGTSASGWNETRSVSQFGDGQTAALYRPQPAPWTQDPLVTGATERVQYNPDGSVRQTASSWSELPAFAASQYFLVPRAKWAVTSLFGLGFVILCGLGEWQVLLGAGRSQWSQGGALNADGFLDYSSTEAILIGVIGLCTIGSVMSLGYAAMPPRTVLDRGGSAAAHTVVDSAAPEANPTGRGSISEPRASDHDLRVVV